MIQYNFRRLDCMIQTVYSESGDYYIESRGFVLTLLASFSDRMLGWKFSVSCRNCGVDMDCSVSTVISDYNFLKFFVHPGRDFQCYVGTYYPYNVIQYDRGFEERDNFYFWYDNTSAEICCDCGCIDHSSGKNLLLTRILD